MRPRHLTRRLSSLEPLAHAPDPQHEAAMQSRAGQHPINTRCRTSHHVGDPAQRGQIENSQHAVLDREYALLAEAVNDPADVNRGQSHRVGYVRLAQWKFNGIAIDHALGIEPVSQLQDEPGNFLVGLKPTKRHPSAVDAPEHDHASRKPFLENLRFLEQSRSDLATIEFAEADLGEGLSREFGAAREDAEVRNNISRNQEGQDVAASVLKAMKTKRPTFANDIEMLTRLFGAADDFARLSNGKILRQRQLVCCSVRSVLVDQHAAETGILDKARTARRLSPLGRSPYGRSDRQFRHGHEHGPLLIAQSVTRYRVGSRPKSVFNLHSNFCRDRGKT